MYTVELYESVFTKSTNKNINVIICANVKMKGFFKEKYCAYVNFMYNEI